MFQIPRAPLVLGLAGLIPFLGGALIAIGMMNEGMPPPAEAGYLLVPPQDGLALLVLYGTIILSFMSGVLWGFAAKSQGLTATTGYILSVIPALWAFLMRGSTDTETVLYLLIGFLGLLVLDYYFYRLGLTPPWWMRLRLLLTSIVVMCLTVGFTG
jgi:hypothetical protein